MINVSKKLAKYIEELIRFSKTNQLDYEILNYSQSNQNNLMGSREIWKNISCEIEEHNLFHLIKGFVLYEQELDKQSFGLGGSVAPSIILCKQYAARFPEKESELIEWVVKHRVNPYLPYGTITFNECKSFKEREDVLKEYEIEKNIRKQKEDALQNELKKAKHEREAIKATHDLPNAVRRGDLNAVKSLVAKGGDLTVLKENKGLLVIAEENDRVKVKEYLENIM